MRLPRIAASIRYTLIKLTLIKLIIASPNHRPGRRGGALIDQTSEISFSIRSPAKNRSALAKIPLNLITMVSRVPGA